MYISPLCLRVAFSLSILLILISLSVTQTAKHMLSIEEGINEAASSDAVLLSCKKAICWLHHMARKDLACRRDFKLCHILFCRIASSKDLNCEDVPSPSLLQSLDYSGPNAFHSFSRLQLFSELSTGLTDPFFGFHSRRRNGWR